MEKLHLSPILAFIALILNTIADQAPILGTPWQPLLHATAAFIIALSLFLVSQGLITITKSGVPNISPILGFFAVVLNTIADQPPLAGTPWQPFLHAIAAFILAIAVFLIAQGVITARKLLKRG